MDDAKIQKILKDMMDSIQAITENGQEGHFALKLTALLSIDVMTSLSKAQQIFLEQVLQFEKQEYITAADIKRNLNKMGINFIDQEVDELVNMLKFEDNKTERISTLEIYANAHLF